MTELSEKLNYDREVIRVWFCNKRQALKNTIKKLKAEHVGPWRQEIHLAQMVPHGVVEAEPGDAGGTEEAPPQCGTLQEQLHPCVW